LGGLLFLLFLLLLGAFMAIDCGRRSGCCQGGEGAGAARAMENEP